MRKAILPIVAAIALALGFSSCQHQTMETMEVTVYPGDWVKPATANYYIATVRWGVLDEDVVDFGTVNAYLYDGGRQNMLPYVYPMTYTEDEYGNPLTSPIVVGENIRFDYTYGTITFIIQDLDGVIPGGMNNIPNMTFRVVAIGD